MKKSAGKKARSRRSKKPKTTLCHPTVNPYAAAIDVGACELHAAVPADADPHPVRVFPTFTEDLHALADWFEQCKIRTIALESTGVYWIAIFQILEARGFEVCLVNARHVKNVPGRKTDISDCQWLQYLHSVGLLNASFRPPAQVCAVRTILRHRDALVRYASSHVQHMQKALTQMNIQLANVISDITGKTGLAIVDGILAGERDCEKLAKLRDYRIKADEETIAKSLVGDWKAEHLFTLRQARIIYAHYQTMIVECDQEMVTMLGQFESRVNEEVVEAAPERKKDTEFDLVSEIRRILGVDLTSVPGIDIATISVFLTEVGPTLERFASAKHFSSWLGLCPDNRITGGRVLSAKTRDVKSRMAYALRMAASTLNKNQTALGDYYRRMKARLGSPAAITATAHKLARIVYHLIKNRCAYDESVFAAEEEIHRRRKEKNLRKQAALFGFQLTPLQSNA
jgi:transposase